MRLERIISGVNRAEIMNMVGTAPDGWRVSLAEPKRTNEQNKLMWVLLGCFADQVVHCGRHYGEDVWKAVLMNAFGKEIDFVPSLDGLSVVALGYHSSELSKDEFAQFLEFIYAEGARRGVNFDRDRAA